MQLAELAQISMQVAETRSRREKVARMAAALAAAVPQRGLVVQYLAGQLPQAKLGVGLAQLATARAVPPAPVASLDLAAVDALLAELAVMSGRGAAAQRAALLAALFGRATAAEQAFLFCLLGGELRQGALESLVLEAIAVAASVPLAAVRRAQMLVADLAAVLRVASEEGEAGLQRFALQLFRPVQPMLADTAADVGEALAQLGRAIFECKLDGARVQVHRRGQQVRVYSRALNEVTAAVPELVELVLTLPAEELVLDGEVIALHADGKPRRFQETMRRFGRRLDIEVLRRELPLTAFFFDCLQRDGESLLDASTEVRHAALASLLPAAARVPRLLTDELAAAEAFAAEALAQGHEGVMAKDPAAPYFAGRRGASWLKIKQAHSLDLVVLAAEWGSGRRRGWLSNLHLGARDERSGGFVMLGKTFKGLTDAMLIQQTAELLARETHRDDYAVYVRPELVVEIAFNDVQTSPHYPAGLALRFARVKGYRPDKIAEQADTLEQVRALHALGATNEEPAL